MIKIPPGQVFILVLLLSFLPAAAAQESGAELFDFDIDSLFDDTPELPAETPPPQPADGEATGSGSAGTGTAPAISPGLNVRPKGFSIEAAYNFVGGFSPGWSEAPWFRGERDPVYSTVVGIEASAALALDFQISNSLRVRQKTGFSFPSLKLEIKEFFLDYNFFNRVFLRAGKHTVNWGISRNYEFANLLSRVPSGISSPGDPYTVKADIPIGIGGMQLIALTRPGFMDYDGNSDLSLREIGYGAKYNLAFRYIDIDIGAFYHDLLPLYTSASLKSTIFGNTEVYAEGLFSISHQNWDNIRFSVNTGFIQDFFNDKLTVNAEFFYNGENNALWYKPENDLQSASVSTLVDGFNAALNLVWRPVNWKSFRVYGRLLYGINENTGLLIPGISIKPLENITAYLTANLALGDPDGTYYRQNEDKKNRPFSITLAVQISGSYRYGFYQ